MRARDLFNKAAFFITALTVMNLASCEPKEDNNPPEDKKENGNGDNKDDKKTIFVKMEDRDMYYTSLGTKNGNKVLTAHGALDEPILIATLNPPAGTANSEIDLDVTITTKGTIDMLDNYSVTNDNYPRSNLTAGTYIKISSNREDKKLFEVVGYDLFVSDITYKIADSYKYRYVDLYDDEEARPGDTQYSYYTNNLYHLKKFLEENSKTYSMGVYDNGTGLIKDCKNVHIPHIITGPDGKVSQDSLNAAKNAIKNNYGYGYTRRIEFRATFDAARVDTTYSTVTDYELQKAGVDGSSVYVYPKLRLHR